MKPKKTTIFDSGMLKKFLNKEIIVIEKIQGEKEGFSYGKLAKVVDGVCIIDPNNEVKILDLSEVRLVEDVEKGRGKPNSNKYHFIGYENMTQINFVVFAPNPYVALLYIRELPDNHCDAKLMLVQTEKGAGDSPVVRYKTSLRDEAF